MRPFRRTVLYGAIALFVLLLLFGRALIAFYVDWQWFSELDVTSVFWKIVTARLTVAAVAAVVVAALIGFNLRMTRFSFQSIPFGQIPLPLQRLLQNRRLTGRLVLSVSTGFGFLYGLALSEQWETFELFRKQTPFGITDPIFNLDIGFYFFSLPFYRMILQALNAALMVSLIATGLLYVLSGQIQFDHGRIQIRPSVFRHLGLLLAALFVLQAASYWLGTYDLLQSTRGAVYGVGHTDHHVMITALRLLAGIALIAAALTVYAAVRRSFRPLTVSIVGMIVASLLLGTLWPAIVQRFVVEPNELIRERPYLEHNIALTRFGFGLDRIEQSEFAASTQLDWEKIGTQQSTIDNIRLWDVRPLLDTYRQRQNIRQYYDFSDVDVDRYRLDGEYRQLMLAARELDHRQLEADAQTWVNRHLRFTHGYGLVANPAARVAADGQPEFVVRDIPPQTDVDLTITRPEVYFGEIISPYAVVQTDLEEFSYPVGDSIATTRYEGRAGIPIGSFWQRLIFAAYFGDANLLFSGAIGSESRILIRRQILPRVQKIAPFLRYDEDPYIVVDDEGRLFWIIDAYTTSRAMPYSEPYRGDYAPASLRGVNYIRNAVKVVVDAYHGDVAFYVFDEQDPLIQSYQAIFPELFQPETAMPASLREHARYPLDLFKLQADVYTLYHMDHPDDFYNREDVWALAQEFFQSEAVVMEPYYLIMNLPGEDRPEYVLILPFTPANRNNMIGWMAGRSDGERLGELFVFNLPKDRQVFGPLQVENRINQHDQIARDLALWSQQGTRVIRGNMLVVPIADALLYIEPLYLRSSDGGLPELRRVIVAYGDRQPVMAPTIDEALIALLGTPAPGDPGDERAPATPEPVEPGQPDVADETLAQRILRARKYYEQAMAALRQGDFASYGNYVEQLGALLSELGRSVERAFPDLQAGGGEAANEPQESQPAFPEANPAPE